MRHQRIALLAPYALDNVTLRHLRASAAAIMYNAGAPKPDKDGRYWSRGSAGFGMMLSPAIVREVDVDARLQEARERLGLWGFADRETSSGTVAQPP